MAGAPPPGEGRAPARLKQHSGKIKRARWQKRWKRPGKRALKAGRQLYKP